MLPRWLALAAMAPALLAQAGPPPAASRADAAISGVVTDDATGQPVADAIVQLGSVALRDNPDVQQSQFTDAQGRYVFTDLPASGDYAVVVQKPGYFDGAYGRGSCSAAVPARVVVNAGQWVDDANIRMCRPGSMSGTVFDERGEPVVGVFVRVVQAIRVGGEDRFAVGQDVKTDDRGMYRVGRLRPGRYVAVVPSVQASAPAGAGAAALAGMSPADAERYRAIGRQIPASESMMEAGDARVRLGGYPIPPPPLDGRAFTYPTAFSSGATLSRGGAVTLGVGEDRTGVEIRMNAVPAIRISGVVDGPSDAIGGIVLDLFTEGLEELGAGAEAGTALTAPDGSFTFANVPAGRYVILCTASTTELTVGGATLDIFYGLRRPRTPGAPSNSTVSDDNVPGGPPGVGYMNTSRRANHKLWARTDVDATAGDVRTVRVITRALGTISGRIVIDTDPRFPPPAAAVRTMTLQSASGSTTEGLIGMFGSFPQQPDAFQIDNVPPGLFLFQSPLLGVIKSVLVDGHDYAHVPFDTTSKQNFQDVMVTLTNAGAALGGTIHESAGSPGTRAAAIVFPAEPERWTNYGLFPSRIFSVHASNTGTFYIRQLPAGDYFVVAVPETTATAWQEPAFFARVASRATRVTMGWGESKSVDINVVDVP